MLAAILLLEFQIYASMYLCSLAAKKLIQILQERGEDLKNKNEIIQLGCQYGKQTGDTKMSNLLKFDHFRFGIKIHVLCRRGSERTKTIERILDDDEITRHSRSSSSRLGWFESKFHDDRLGEPNYETESRKMSLTWRRKHNRVAYIHGV